MGKHVSLHKTIWLQCLLVGKAEVVFHLNASLSDDVCDFTNAENGTMLFMKKRAAASRLPQRNAQNLEQLENPFLAAMSLQR